VTSLPISAKLKIKKEFCRPTHL